MPLLAVPLRVYGTVTVDEDAADRVTVMFAVPRTCGWVAHWMEMVGDPEQKISRPRQIYTGSQPRDYVPMAQRRV